MIRKHLLKQQQQKFDVQLLLLVLALVGFGLLMVYDASVVQALNDFGNNYHYIKQQIIWVTLGFLLLIFFSRFDYHRFRPIAFVLLVCSFILLLGVMVPGLGVSGGGAHRWLRIGSITIQPAEIIKLTGIIYLATIFEERSKFVPFAVLTILVSLVTAVFQKDLGTTIVYVSTSIMLYYASGAPIRYFLFMLPPFIGVVSLLIFTSSYRVKRVLAFLDPFSDKQGFTYHISQVLIALGSGGFFGLGLSNSRQKFEYIPEVSTDSIFAIVGEELGFLGAIFLILLFASLIFKGLKIATYSKDNFGRLLAVGLTAWIGIQVIINLSSMVALMPLTGVPLPFISYGGSALVVNLVAVGILLNISKNS